MTELKSFANCKLDYSYFNKFTIQNEQVLQQLINEVINFTNVADKESDSFKQNILNTKAMFGTIPRCNLLLVDINTLQLPNARASVQKCHSEIQMYQTEAKQSSDKLLLQTKQFQDKFNTKITLNQQLYVKAQQVQKDLFALDIYKEEVQDFKTQKEKLQNEIERSSLQSVQDIKKQLLLQVIAEPHKMVSDLSGDDFVEIKTQLNELVAKADELLSQTLKQNESMMNLLMHFKHNTQTILRENGEEIIRKMQLKDEFHCQTMKKCQQIFEIFQTGNRLEEVAAEAEQIQTRWKLDIQNFKKIIIEGSLAKITKKIESDLENKLLHESKLMISQQLKLKDELEQMYIRFTTDYNLNKKRVDEVLKQVRDKFLTQQKLLITVMQNRVVDFAEVQKAIVQLENVLEEISSKVFTKEFYECIKQKVDKYIKTEEEIKIEEQKKMEISGVIGVPMENIPQKVDKRLYQLQVPQVTFKKVEKINRSINSAKRAWSTRRQWRIGGQMPELDVVEIMSDVQSDFIKNGPIE